MSSLGRRGSRRGCRLAGEGVSGVLAGGGRGRGRTVFLHVYYDEGGGEWGEGDVVRPGVGLRGGDLRHFLCGGYVVRTF